MAKINKEVTVTFSASEAAQIIKDYIKENNGWDIENVEFHIEPLTNDRGDYAGQEVDKVVCVGLID